MIKGLNFFEGKRWRGCQHLSLQRRERGWGRWGKKERGKRKGERSMRETRNIDKKRERKQKKMIERDRYNEINRVRKKERDSQKEIDSYYRQKISERDRNR